MNELDILNQFYERMTERGVSRTDVYLSIDDKMIAALNERHGIKTTLEEARALTDICIANEWLERTTIDPHYNFLSLTEAGLQFILAQRYR